MVRGYFRKVCNCLKFNVFIWGDVGEDFLNFRVNLMWLIIIGNYVYNSRILGLIIY